MHGNIEFYRDVLALAQLGIWERNIVTGKVYWNKAIFDIYEDPAFVPELSNSLKFYKEPHRLELMVVEAIRTKQPQEARLEIITAKGNMRWVKARVNAAFENDECVRLYGTLEDITENHNLHTRLAEREESFHQAFNFAPIGMAIVSTKGEWIRVNQSICNLFGFEPHEFINHTFQEITYHEDLDTDLNLMNQLLEGGIGSYNLEKRYYHKNGKLIWVQLSVTLVRDKEDRPLYFISQLKDITERRKYTDALLKERQRLDNIIKSTRVGTWEWDVEANTVYANQRAMEIFGFTFREIGLAPMSNWIERVHPDDKLSFQEEFEACFAREHDYYFCECRMQHKNGNWIWVEIRGKVINWTDDKQALRMLGTFADIHQRKTQEQERREVMKQLSFQNERLTNFAHIVSHNLLSHSGNMNMLLDVFTQEEDAEEQRTLMNMMKINSINLYNTLRHLSEVVDIQSGRDKKLQQMNLRKEILKAFETLSESIKEVRAVADINVPDELEVTYPPAYLDSILLNLLSNCIKYRSPERALQVTINAFKVDDTVQLTIADNGLGIDLNIHRAKLFGMYKTFHGNKNARGIGLFMIKNQIEVMGGTIDVESEPGNGTTFIVRF